MRFVTPVLACFLALAAAGRFHAEASVREARGELRDVREASAATLDEEGRLRLEVEVLESAGRFEEVNERTLRLRAPEPEQLTTGDDFAARLGREADSKRLPADSDVIANAITMADPEATAP